MATEAMVSKFECYSNYVVEYDATDGDFEGESQKLGRRTAKSHLIGRDGPQRCSKVFIQRGSPASLGCRLINSGWGVSDVTGVPIQLGICLFIAVLESKVVYMRS